MTCLDYVGFTSMVLLVIGAANWGTVAIRYVSGALPGTEALDTMNITATSTGQEIYMAYPTPDLLNLLTTSVMVQMIVYFAVFGASIVYLALFVYNSIEVRTVE